MTAIDITHTAADGTLADGMIRGDGTYEILRANGFRWFRSLGMMGIQSSRDRQPNEYKINRAARALTEAGHTVTVEIDRAHNALGKAVAADREADHAAQRAESAARTTELRNSPVTVANRIHKLEAEQRADQRALDGHTRTLFTDGRGVKHTEQTTAATGEYRERIIARMAERAASTTGKAFAPPRSPTARPATTAPTPSPPATWSRSATTAGRPCCAPTQRPSASKRRHRLAAA